jgi:ferredoxin-type protein NapG
MSYAFRHGRSAAGLGHAMTDMSRRRFLFPVSRQPPATPAPSPPDPLPRAISWLADHMGDAAEPPLPARAKAAPLLRPPGAIEESRFLKTCTRCGDCKAACPHDAIDSAGPMYRDAVGTPRIDPSRAPCWLCEDLPCIAACKVEALVADGDRMGEARINWFDCLNAMGTKCTVCAERCPTRAIVFAGERPTVSQRLCVGCGVCQYVCPAPLNAVAILPNPNRHTKVAPHG